ncbi:transcriptional regulator, MarR family [Solidesulfovibrio fructosivorans JJ]]|uniref:Transcriptional regulator, MarR family n=2 Tax=Solidesulfovibrio fructosivorans TaxID=878 RepID=E1K0U8_SOLFR|nr:transcriptional regulator, MarR family [Solidesulfovibrio fructosivorans JJ]]
MRNEKEVMPLFQLLGAVLTKFASIERTPVDFGIGPTLFPAEVHMLSTIEMLDAPTTVTAVATACGVTKGAVSQTLKRLEAKSLIQRDGPGGRGGVGLTPRGRQACQAHMAFHREHDRDFLTYLRKLPDEDFATCLEFCRHLKMWMERYPR